MCAAVTQRIKHICICYLLLAILCKCNLAFGVLRYLYLMLKSIYLQHVALEFFSKRVRFCQSNHTQINFYIKQSAWFQLKIIVVMLKRVNLRTIWHLIFNSRKCLCNLCNLSKFVNKTFTTKDLTLHITICFFKKETKILSPTKYSL